MNHSEEALERLRHKMVRDQLLGRDIKDNKVLSVFRKVPRHRFVDPAMCEDAYRDFPLSIGRGQTISQPYIVALMVQLLDVAEGDKVLEIGTGSGYETAILSELGANIFSIERIELLAIKAEKVLKKFGYKNVHIKTGDGTLGWQESAPFDKIIVTAGSLDIPGQVLGQLSRGGKMVIPIGSRFSQRLILSEKDKKGGIFKKDICGCVFVPLVGKYGWEENSAGADI
jgi:protein-L-isoaspartate(D-aspartate) O-methyltransferase